MVTQTELHPELVPDPAPDPELVLMNPVVVLVLEQELPIESLIMQTQLMENTQEWYSFLG